MSESVSLNDRPYDLAKGRVFLIDLSVKAVTVRQVRADLAAPIKPTTAEQVETIAKDHLKRLKLLPAATAFSGERPG